jgi:hypothetical protein
MEAPAPTDAPADCRDLLAAVAEWLPNLGFSLERSPPGEAASATLDARWEGAGQGFRLLLQATPTEARCHLWSRERGLVFTWMKVHSLRQVQELLTQHPAFHAAQQAQPGGTSQPLNPH